MTGIMMSLMNNVVVVSNDPVGPTDGTQVAWTDDTYFDSYTSQSGITNSDNFPTNSLCWQVYYAHRALTIPADGTNRVGINTYQNGSNTINWRVSVSNADDTLGSFATDTQFANQSFSYVAGGFNQQPADTAVSIPANRYFLIGVVAGPYYRSFKTLAANRTAYISGTPYVTVLNTVYYAPHTPSITSGIPTQLGGAASGFTEYTDRVSVTSIKFKL